MVRPALALALALVPSPTLGDMFDIVLPKYTSTCEHGCMPWADVKDFTDPGLKTKGKISVGSLFADGSVPADIGSSCAMPAAHAGNHECDCGAKAAFNETYMLDSYAGPWCFCKDPSTEPSNPEYNTPLMSYCEPPHGVPEQINLQLAASDVIVAGFVTYEELPTSPPVAMFGKKGEVMKQITGVSHAYNPGGHHSLPNKTSASVPYIMSFIKFATDEPRTEYQYKIKSGGANAQWSDTFTFRSAYDSTSVKQGNGETRVLTYGDMGHSQHNCMENAKRRCENGDIDAIVHMGDHAYDLGFIGDRRGDAYMNAFQPTLTSCPWFPIIGNHESDDGDHYKHYQALAWGEPYGNGGAPFPVGGAVEEEISAQQQQQQPRGGADSVSTANNAMGAFLTKHTMYGMSSHGTTPSNTSRYASTDIGLLHMVGLDLNSLDPTQIAWLEADLAHANENRDKTPWIMVMSHFPVYHSRVVQHLDRSLMHYLGDELTQQQDNSTDGEEHFVPVPAHCQGRGSAAGPECATIGEFQKATNDALQPILHRYGVDIYNAGHVHDYENTWPLCQENVTEPINPKNMSEGNHSAMVDALCDGAQHYTNPQGPIHVTEGNGGVPGVVAATKVQECGAVPSVSICRMHASGGNYGRWTIYNASVLLYEHVHNTDDNVTDSWIVTQEKHGPFKYPSRHVTRGFHTGDSSHE